MKVSFSARTYVSYGSGVVHQSDVRQSKDVNLTSVKDEYKSSKNNAGKYIMYGLAALALGFIGYKILRRGDKVEELASQGSETIKNAYNTIIRKFPEDREYYSRLAAGIGLPKGEEYKLASVVGEKQLIDMLQSGFKPIDFKIGQNFEGLKDASFRVNLHNHTAFSDGKLSVEEFLEHSRLWADKVYSKVGADNKPPFTIAITDHDTMEGTKEALRIIANDPEKFKNLRVVLGAEISVSHINPQDVEKPFNFELIGYAVNPFNEKLSGLLADTVNNRIGLVRRFVEDLSQKYPQLSLNWAEAVQFHPNLAKGTSNGAVWLVHEYVRFKMYFQNVINQINAGIERSENKLDASALMLKYAKNYYYKMDTGKDGVTRGNVLRYFETLKDIEGYKCPKIDESKIDFGIISNVEKMRNEYIFNSDCMLKNGIVLTPQMVFEAARKGGNEGFFGIAHPGFFNLTDCTLSNSFMNYCLTNNCNPALHFVWTLVKSMKDAGGKLFNAMEKNYQSYGNDIGKQQWGDKIYEIAQNGEIKLLKAGGLDCHRTIFTKHEVLDKDFMSRLGIDDIMEKQ